VADATEHDESPAEAQVGETADGAAGESVVETPESVDAPLAQVTDASTPGPEIAESVDGSDGDDVAAAIAAAGENVAADADAAAVAEMDSEPEPDTTTDGAADTESAPEGVADTEADAAAEPATESAADAETAAATEQSLDDIAPGTTGPDQVESSPEAAADGRSANKVSIWPFVIYDVLWLIFAGLLVWQFEALPQGAAIYEAELYPVALLVGLILLIAGPLLIFVSWIASWGRPGSSKGRLLISALIRGSVATLIGVAIWWIALLVLDQIRLGMLL